jgi:predicted ATPase
MELAERDKRVGAQTGQASASALLRSGRRQLHARITVTLESHFPDIVAARPQLLAQHSAEAGLNEKAIRYCLKAASKRSRAQP